MKLHLPKALFAAVLACLGAVPVALAADAGVISVNFGTTAVPGTATGELNGVSAAGWTNITGNAATVNGWHNVTDSDGASAKVYVFAPQAPWGPGGAQTDTLLKAIHASYLDLSASNNWTVKVASDYLVSDVTLYMAGDGSVFAPVNVNGTNYAGGTNVRGEAAWGDRATANSDVSDDTNTVKVTGITGGLIETSNKAINQATRGTIGGLQVIDATAAHLYTTALGAGTVNAADATWTKGTDTASLADIAATARIMGTTGTGTINFAEGTSLVALQADGGTATVTGSGLTIGTLFAKSGSTLDFAGTLAADSTVSTGGMGTVKFSANQTLNTLNQGSDVTIASGTTVSVATWNNTAGTLSTETGSALNVTGNYDIKVAKGMIDAFSGEGTLHFTAEQTGWQPNGSAITIDVANKKIAFDDGLVLNGWGQANQKMDILTGGDVTVSAKTLQVRRMYLTVDGGKLTASEGIAIGHPEVGDYKGGVTLASGEINTSSIQGANRQSGNAFKMTGGTLNASGASVFGLADNTWYGTNGGTAPRLEVTISGGTIATTADGALLVAAADSASTALPLSIGDVTFEVKGSSLDINHAYTQTGTITHAGTGALTISGNVSISSIEVLDEASSSVRTFSEGDNGYVGGTFVLVDKAAGSGSTSVSGTVTVNGAAQTVISKDSGLYLAVTGTGGTYFVNSGNVAYEDGATIASEHTTGITLENGTLALNKALATGIGITAASVDGTRTIAIAKDVTLAKGSLTAEGATQLSGAGSFNLGASADMPTNVTLASDWTGTVVVDGFTFGDPSAGRGSGKLGQLANANSNVGLTRCTGWLEPGGTVSANLKLLTGDAITLTDGSSDRTQTFSGKVSGDGNFVIGMAGKDVGGITYDFSGDVSDWSGTFKTTAPTGKTFNLKFSGSSDIGASVENGTGITLNVTISGDSARTVKGSIGGAGTTNLNLTGSGVKTFEKSVAVSTLNLAGGATFNKGATIGTLNVGPNVNSAAGDRVVKSGEAISVGTLNTNAGTLVLDGVDMTVTETYDMRGGENKVGKISLTKGSTLTSNVSMWGRGNGVSTISVDETSSFKQNGFTISAAAEGTPGVVSLADGIFNVQDAESIKNASITYANTWANTVAADLTGSSLSTVAGSGKLTLSTASVKSLDLHSDVEVAANLTADSTTLSNASITIADGKTFTSGNEAVTNLTSGTAATIATTGTDKLVSVATEGLTYTNANITFKRTNDEDLVTNATLSGSKVIVTGADGEVDTDATVTVNVDDTTNTFDASKGNVSVESNGATAKAVLTDIGEGKSVTFSDDAELSGTAAQGTITAANVTVAENQTLTVGATTIDGNVDVTGATSGQLVISSVKTEIDPGVLSVTGDLTANTTNLTLTSTAVSAINTGVAALEGDDPAAFLIANVGGAVNFGGQDLSKGAYTLTSSDITNWGLTEKVDGRTVNYTLASLNMMTTENPLLVLSAQLAAADTLTATTVTGGVYDAANHTLALTASVDDVTAITLGSKLDVVFDSEEVWKAIVNGQDIYQNATVTLTLEDLNGGSLTVPGSTVLSFYGYEGTGTDGEYFVAYIPEPATGTLSVLALAALAMRRRRKH